MISTLRVVDFRCFTVCATDFESNRVFLTGANAQGKTSLLEAVAVASRLGSPRASRQSQMVREGSAGCGVAIKSKAGLFKAVYEGGKFELAHDGEACKKKDYLAMSPRVVWMENRDLEIIRGSGERRRRYLDAIGSQLSPQYAKVLRDYTKVVRSRNALLKEQRANSNEFHAFSELLVEYGRVLTDFRSRIIHDLLPHIREAHGTIASAKEQFSITYQPSSTNLEEDLAKSLPQDCVMKQSLVGPHRDDFAVLVDNRPACDFASEGQQRTLAISLKLAQGALLSATAEDLIYLVDDIFGELDPVRRSALMAAFPATSQSIFTTTEINWEQGDAQVFTLKDSKVERA